jgi:hypothetical protein
MQGTIMKQLHFEKLDVWIRRGWKFLFGKL